MIEQISFEWSTDHPKQSEESADILYKEVEIIVRQRDLIFLQEILIIYQSSDQH